MKRIMAKNKKSIFALSIIFVLCIMFAVVSVSNAKANETNQWSGETVEAEYEFGKTFNVPKRTIGSGNADISHVLTFPDGTTSYSKSVTLNQSGKYGLVYTAELSGKVFTESHNFMVRHTLYGVTDAASSVAYGTPSNVRNENVKGVTVSLAQKDKFTINQAISVENFRSDNYFIEGFIMNQSAGISDFGRLNITLTDFENPDIFVRIVLNERPSQDIKGIGFAAANANGQNLVGLENNYGSDKINTVHKNDGLGQWIYMPFRGQHSIGIGSKTYTYDIYADDYPFRFSFDSQTKEIWHSTNFNVPVDRTELNAAPDGSDVIGDKSNIRIENADFRKIVTDLDNSEYYESVWGGFESGYVKLSVSAENYNSNLARFCITKVAGVDLSKTDFEVNEKPIITVNTKYEEMPEATVGNNYPIPTATAKDLYSGEVDVTTTVWYNYSSEDKMSVNIGDGKFFVDKAGYYAIVYSATNRHGLTAEKVLWVHASNEGKPISVQIDSENRITECKVGEYIDYAKAAISGGSGDVSLKTYAKKDSVVIDTENGFRPEKTGIWTVVYEATDYVGNKTVESYEVNVLENDKPVLTDKIVLPKVYVSKAEFTFPEIYANIYGANGANKELCSVKTEYNGQTKTYKAGDAFVPEVANNGDKIKVTYSCKDTELYSEEIPCAVLYEGKTMRYENYFITSASGRKTTQSGYVLSAGEGEDEISLLYANPVVAQSSSFRFRCFVNNTAENYDEVVVTLTDAADYDNSVRVIFKEVNGKVCMYTGSSVYRTDYSFTGKMFDLTVGYKDGAFVYDGASYDPEFTVNGKEFDGFTSDKVYLSVNVKNVKADSEFSVLSIRGYRFADQTADRVKPYIVVNGEIASMGEMGKKLHIPSVSVGDVISPNVETKMQVFAPDGTYVKDVNGKELNGCDPFGDYWFNVTQTGQYRVTYNYKESNKFGVTLFDDAWSYSIYVYDTEDPVIELTSAPQVTAKVGDKLIVPDYKVTDDISAKENIITYVYLTTPSGMIQILTEKAVVCTKRGTYSITITAIDEAGNIGVKTIYIKVV